MILFRARDMDHFYWWNVGGWRNKVHGIEKEISFNRHEICSTCDGSGAKEGTSPQTCATCRGAGEVRQARQTFLGSMVNVTVSV